MRPPFIEAGPLLAAHGHTPSRPIPFRRRPTMSQDVRFALLKSNPHAKPLVFPDVDALARHIQRERGTAAIDLEQVEDLEIGGDAGARPGVSVFTLDLGNDRDQLIGHAYLDGRGREHLQAALRRNRLVMADDQAEAA